MANAFDNAGIFLITTLFDIYILILILRLMLVWMRADYYHPLSQFVVKLTQPLIGPLRRVIPNIKKIEVSTLILILVFEMIKFFLIGLMTLGVPNFFGLVILAFADFLKFILNIFFYAILLQAILSWVQPYSPLSHLLAKITYPMLRPIQRIIPSIGGFDISPIFALIVLQVIIILVTTPLFALGLSVAFGNTV